MSLTNFSVALLVCYDEIKHADVLLQVMWLALTIKNALFHNSVTMLGLNLWMTQGPVFATCWEMMLQRNQVNEFNYSINVFATKQIFMNYSKRH